MSSRSISVVFVPVANIQSFPSKGPSFPHILDLVGLIDHPVCLFASLFNATFAPPALCHRASLASNLNSVSAQATANCNLWLVKHCRSARLGPYASPAKESQLHLTTRWFGSQRNTGRPAHIITRAVGAGEELGERWTGYGAREWSKRSACRQVGREAGWERPGQRQGETNR